MILILVGPSGCGKTEIGKQLNKELEYEKAVSCTTRIPRIGEVEAIDYFFKNNKSFFETQLIEYTEYPKGSGKYYGLSVEAFNNPDKDIYCIVEISGALKIKEMFPNAKLIFINCDEDILEKRMRERGDKEENIKERLDNIKNCDEYSSMNYADFILDNNESMENTMKTLENYINSLKSITHHLAT